MILFLDTSALVKLFQSETGTQLVIKWVEGAHKITLLDLARLEFKSALQRRLRNKELTQDELLLLQEGFQERWLSFNIQPLNSKVVDEAELLLEKYGDTFGLRTLDALHAAAFQLVAEKNWFFVASDKNLCMVIDVMGFEVLNPLEQ
jgi:uncharacterized protein